jgi:hypothetical protein
MYLRVKKYPIAPCFRFQIPSDQLSGSAGRNFSKAKTFSFGFWIPSFLGCGKMSGGRPLGWRDALRFLVFEINEKCGAPSFFLFAFDVDNRCVRTNSFVELYRNEQRRSLCRICTECYIAEIRIISGVMFD